MQTQLIQSNTKKTTFILFLIFSTILLVWYYKNESNKNVLIVVNITDKKDTDLNENIKNLEYIKIHEDIVFNRTLEQHKKIVFYLQRSDVGYGNNVYSYLTALLTAILTESALLVDWPQIEKYIEEPLKFAYTKFKDSSYLDFNQKKPTIYGLNLVSINTWKFEKILNINETLPDKYSRISVRSIEPYFFDLCSNPNYFGHLLKSKLVSNATLERARTALVDPNVIKWQKMEYLFLVGFEFAGTALNRHWILNKNNGDMITKLNTFLDREFKNAFVIGMQLRFESLNNNTDVELFIKCASRIEQRVKLIDANNKNEIGNRTLKWFVCSDSEKFINDMTKKYPNKVIHLTDGVIKHVANDANGYERALLDIEILSRTDEMILTGGSSFGFVAALKAQKRPWVVEGLRAAKECELFQFYAPARRGSNNAAMFK